MDKLTPPKPRPYCPICWKHHAGECWKATGGCYQCGEVGHHIHDCSKPTQKSRKLARAQAEAAKTSAAQEAPSQVPAQVIPVPHPKCPTCRSITLENTGWWKAAAIFVENWDIASVTVPSVQMPVGLNQNLPLKDKQWVLDLVGGALVSENFGTKFL